MMSTIDLARCLAQRGESDEARSALERAGLLVANMAGSHGWVGGVRLAVVRAEAALARQALDEALTLAGEALERALGMRPKYAVLAELVRAGALAARGQTGEAVIVLDDVRATVIDLDDPALTVRWAAARLELGDDAEARRHGDRAATNIAASLDAAARERFEGRGEVRAVRAHPLS
jgi:Flp pilus assembly protein TadD